METHETFQPGRTKKKKAAESSGKGEAVFNELCDEQLFSLTDCESHLGLFLLLFNRRPQKKKDRRRG